jgi:hypothetical protein
MLQPSGGGPPNTSIVAGNSLKNSLKNLLPAIKKLIEDSAPEVRDKCIVVLGRMKSAYGDAFFGNLLADVNPT